MRNIIQHVCALTLLYYQPNIPMPREREKEKEREKEREREREKEREKEREREREKERERERKRERERTKKQKRIAHLNQPHINAKVTVFLSRVIFSRAMLKQWVGSG